MKRDRDKSSLTLITLATLVMGLDYTSVLFFPDLGALLSLNRVLFLGIIVYDSQAHPSKYSYSTGGPIYVVCYFILVAFLPFLVFVEADVTGPVGAFNEFTGLLGTFAYMLFFYVNCRSIRVASRICVVLYLCSFLMVVYLLGIVLGVTGQAVAASREGVYYLRASGDFDPNIVMIYLISSFAFGPLLVLYSRAFAGFWRGMVVVALICLSIYTTLQLNSRSGTVVMAASLFVSIMFRLFLAPSRKPFLRAHTMSFVAFLVSIPVFLQWKYGIFDTIIAIYQVTNLYEDSSFAIRILAYEYLGNELLNSTYLPNFLGSPAGYSGFWRVSRGMFNPHFSLLDIYIKGGMVYLCVYIYLLASSILRCLRGALEGKDVRQKAVFAGFLAYVVGFLPLMVTLSIEDTKMPWGIIGCVLGFTAHTRISVARVKRRARTIEVEDVAQCPG